MTYPPTGGYDPQQYHVSSQPPQPNDPYSQGYSAQPPPPNYDPGQQGQYPPPQPGYDPSQGQYPPPPNMTPPVGVQPGYPQGGSPLPPPIPPASQGSNLGVILGIIVGLVVILGVAAVLIVPGMLEDDDDSAQAGDDTTSEPTEEEPSEEPSDDPEESPTPEETQGTDDTGGFDGWSTPVSSEDFDPNTPEGAALSWQIGVDHGDEAALAEVMCASPSASLQAQYDAAASGDGDNYNFLLWGLAKAEQNGQVEVWAGWTWSDAAPASEDDMISGGDYFSAVEEDGTWKVCDVWY
ncbi:MAG TPA: hypothetical protein VFU12_07375 [Glycomyces sp.]|nr:hypothetical protein [Glycomyces sp.]